MNEQPSAQSLLTNRDLMPAIAMAIRLDEHSDDLLARAIFFERLDMISDQVGPISLTPNDISDEQKRWMKDDKDGSYFLRGYMDGLEKVRARLDASEHPFDIAIKNRIKNF